MANVQRKKSSLWLSGILCLIFGLFLVVKRYLIADMIDTQDGYVFICGMFFIFWGIKEIVITPLLNDKDRKD